MSKIENLKIFNYLISVWHFLLLNDFIATSICSHLTLSYNYDEKQAKSTIALSAMYKIKYIHKIIKSVALKCTLDISCHHSFENKENNR